MLKNWFYNPRIRNFIKSTFFIDFFLKKLVKKILTILNSFTIFFLEKFFVELVPKNLKLLLSSILDHGSVLKTTFLPVVLVVLNIFILIILALVW